ncbi:MAG TPA: right-handed parallel beta-helix repeat-containing protein, partial [Dehalococcoidia bacterium]|nr:right-handed parallel beta-helix repeat-containing protein [Dehalococcoidia bacterium]
MSTASAPFHVIVRAPLVIALILSVTIFSGAHPAYAAFFTVTSTGDGPDSNTGDNLCNDGAGHCTLRAAIEQANATPGHDLINFVISGGVGEQTILPSSPLPTIIDPVTIDAFTQQCALASGHCIDIAGGSAGPGANGLTVTAGSTSVKWLSIHSFSDDGIELSGAGNNVIENNFIGTGLSGNEELLGNGSDGILIYGVSGNDVGAAEGTENVISGNGKDGIELYGNGASGNHIGSNLIGLGVTGDARGNDADGIRLFHAPNNVIGDTDPSRRIFISANGERGIDIVGAGATGNVVRNVSIGTNAFGLAPLPNALDGIRIFDAPGNTIGQIGTPSNLISGNGGNGILLAGNGTTGNLIEKSLIGTNGQVSGAIPNSENGIKIDGSAGSVSGNTIGGGAAGLWNFISGNTLS